MTSLVLPHRRHGFAVTRQQIIEAAREIMREEGVGALSLHEVARRVGMKAPSLYTYFESKHALYDEVFRLGMQKYRAEVEELERNPGDGPGSLEASIRHYMRFADENPELYSLLFERPVPGFEPSAASMAEAEGLLADAGARVNALLDAGTIRSGLPVDQTRDIVIVLMHGLTSLKRANEPEAGAGEGRFDALVPHIVALLRAAWMPEDGPVPGGHQ
ncbi:MAG: TetR/AcrR family transcriptional regulator [Chloroflexi bacterium]|nr:TetR/AcrR family transcriptional regulator [Chloroflexota bacterium]